MGLRDNLADQCFYEGYDKGTPCLHQPGCLAKKLQAVKQAIQSLLKKDLTFCGIQ